MNADNQPKGNPVPEFATREEEAAFWDTHDFADYWDDLKPVSVTFGDDLGSPIVINLDPATRQRVSKAAHDSDTEPDALVHQWIMAGLQAHTTD